MYISLLYSCSSEVLEGGVDARTEGFLLLLGWERVPKTERLIASARHESLAVRAAGEVEDSEGVACESG